MATKGKYGNRKITTSGHSLGGGQSLYVAEKFGIPGFHFDPAISVRAVIAKGLKAPQKIFRTMIDPVSGLSPLANVFRKARKTTLVKMSPSSKNMHGLTQMTAEPEFILKEGKRIPLTTEGGSAFLVRKVPHHVTLTKGVGYLADVAYVIMSGMETRKHIAHDDVPLNTGSPEELDELAYVPGMAGTFLTEGTIEERALTKLGKSLFGSGFHSEADIRRYEQQQRRARDQGTTITDDSWRDRLATPKIGGRLGENDVWISDDGKRYVEVP